MLVEKTRKNEMITGAVTAHYNCECFKWQL